MTDDSGDFIHGEPFSVLPEWVLDADISDRALRLYAVLARYVNRQGRAFPGRPRLAERLRCSVDSVDRAMVELVDLGAVVKRPRVRDNGTLTSNSYWLRRDQPGAEEAEVAAPPRPGVAAPPRPPSRTPAAGRNENQRTRASREHSSAPPEPSVPEPLRLVSVAETSCDRFTEFWSVYPRRVARGDAEKAWKAALKKAKPDTIIDGARRYGSVPGREMHYTAYPASWLRAERWTDESDAGAGGPHGVSAGEYRDPVTGIVYVTAGV